MSAVGEADESALEPLPVVVRRRRATSDPSRAGVDPWWSAAVVLLGIAILAQGARAVADGWVPSGDDGFWSIMARSVFSSRPPLLGSSSSGGVVSGDAFFHLGPLGFYLLAPFVALLGGVGVAVGTAVINAASAVVAALAVRSGVGTRAGWFAVIGSAALAFVMGSELLVDPWNPHLATMPLWCGLACAWAVLRGRPAWAAPGMLAVSLSFQTHLSFVPVAGLVGLVILSSTFYWCRREAVRPRAAGEQRGPLRSWAPFLWACEVTLLANLVPLIQQFFGAGPGNLTNALSGSAGQDDTIGRAVGAQVISHPFLNPVNWMPGSWRPQVTLLVDLGPGWIIAVVIVAAVALGVVAGKRRSWLDLVTMIFSVALCLTGLFVASRTAIRLFGVPLTLARWAWPLALFVQIAIIETAIRLWNKPAGAVARWRSASPWPSVMGLLLTVGLLVANVPHRDEGSGAKSYYRQPVNDVLDAGAQRVAELGKPFVVINWNLIAAETTIALLDWLDERGIPFALDEPVALRQVGTHHTLDGTERSTVELAGGPAVLDGPPEGFDRVAETIPLTDAEVDWYLEQRALLESRFPDVVRRLADDPSFREDAGVDPSARIDPETIGWSSAMCSEYGQIPLGSAVIEDELIDDRTRQRLCDLDEQLEFGAVAIDIGPPPDESDGGP